MTIYHCLLIMTQFLTAAELLICGHIEGINLQQSDTEKNLCCAIWM